MYDDPTVLDWPVPGPLEVVQDLDGVMAGFAAERLLRVDELRDFHLARAGAAGRVLTDVVLRGLRLELAGALRITEHAAGRLIGLAEAVVNRYPEVLVALREARITERHVEVLVAGVDELEPGLRDELAGEALVLAEGEPVGVFRRKLRTLIDTARVVTVVARQEEALARRRVWVEHEGEGMSWIHVYGPTVEAHAIQTRVTAIAKTILIGEGETRTLNQVRADVVADLLIDGVVSSHPDQARGIRASVVVTVPAVALLQADDAGVAGAGCDPAVVEGVGPIPIARARELCGGDGQWMRVLTHPETGMVLSVGRDRYTPPASLRRLVRWRADRCMAPGCGVPASRCEIDHTVAWEHGGHTSSVNLAPLCKGHHRVKHHGGWGLRQVPDSGGVVEWTSPAGRRYLVPPERRVPVYRVTDPDPDMGVNHAAPF
ncbi:HNH endonuclease signature motif containing protein [Microbacterium sp. SLBN-146]|uniref:HNH endonuclease signature motif containing protein n=1 Tax=Microbacterium sp. SLBN-146 TaxID=2768457 RepID=UPI0011549944|nr:HNH endonuclease signature motif containing protein [Microbacterium sp. SLBN-146]